MCRMLDIVLKDFTSITSPNPHNNPEKATVTIQVLHMRHREFKQLVQCHTAKRQWSQEPNPSSVIKESILYHYKEKTCLSHP